MSKNTGYTKVAVALRRDVARPIKVAVALRRDVARPKNRGQRKYSRPYDRRFDRIPVYCLPTALSVSRISRFQRTINDSSWPVESCPSEFFPRQPGNRTLQHRPRHWRAAQRGGQSSRGRRRAGKDDVGGANTVKGVPVGAVGYALNC